jgi:hypothetical protein
LVNALHVYVVKQQGSCLEDQEKKYFAGHFKFEPPPEMAREN